MSILSLIAVRWTLVALAASGAAASVANAQSPVCAADERFSANRELRYVVNARVRPLLFWIQRSHVGQARITWSRAASAERLELLVGSDPERTPLRVNRWGYIAETVCQAGADVIGVMTESEEASAEQAAANTSGAKSGRQSFRAIRSRVQQGRSDADVSRFSVAKALTYHELGELLPVVFGASGEQRGVLLAKDAQPGFLLAVVSLANQALAQAAGPRRPIAPLAYVYNGQLFDLEVASGDVRDGEHEIEFRTRNRATGGGTRFTIRFDDGGRSLLPTRIRFRPRWWFEAELVLDRPATLTAAAAIGQRNTP